MSDNTSISERIQQASNNISIDIEGAITILETEGKNGIAKVIDLLQELDDWQFTEFKALANAQEDAGREKSALMRMVSLRQILDDEMKRVNKELQEFDERRRDFLLGQKQMLFNLSDKIKDSAN